MWHPERLAPMISAFMVIWPTRSLNQKEYANQFFFNITSLEFARSTLQGTNISHLGKRKIIFKMPFWEKYVSSLEGNYCISKNGLLQWIGWFQTSTMIGNHRRSIHLARQLSGTFWGWPFFSSLTWLPPFCLESSRRFRETFCDVFFFAWKSPQFREVSWIFHQHIFVETWECPTKSSEIGEVSISSKGCRLDYTPRCCVFFKKKSLGSPTSMFFVGWLVY